MCVRPIAPCHASAVPFPPCVPSAAVRLSAAAQVAAGSSPSPTASMGTSSSRQGGWVGSTDWHRGRGAHRFEGGEVVYGRRRAARRRFAACLEAAHQVVQRRDTALSDQWRVELCPGYAAIWFQVMPLPGTRTVSDSVCTYHFRVVCNVFNELWSPPQSCHGPRRPISFIHGSNSIEKTAWNQK
jgi:hypothetical protein